MCTREEGAVARVMLTSLAPYAFLRSPEKRDKITPVCRLRHCHLTKFRNCTCRTPRVVDFFSRFLPEKGKAMYSHSAIQSVERVLSYRLFDWGEETS